MAGFVGRDAEGAERRTQRAAEDAPIFEAPRDGPPIVCYGSSARRPTGSGRSVLVGWPHGPASTRERTLRPCGIIHALASAAS